MSKDNLMPSTNKDNKNLHPSSSKLILSDIGGGNWRVSKKDFNKYMDHIAERAAQMQKEARSDEAKVWNDLILDSLHEDVTSDLFLPLLERANSRLDTLAKGEV